MSINRVTLLAIAAALLCVLPTAWGQNKSADRERTAGFDAIIDNIDLLIDQYTKFLARKYNLTEEQDEYTKELLRERAYEFIDKHEDDLRQLVDRMFDVRSGGEMTQEELIEWGKQAQPLYEEAKRLIIEGNEEWREILTPEQRKLHDEDVKLMYESFRTTEDQLRRIISGEMTVDEFRSPRRSAHKRSQRAARKRPHAGEPPPPPPEPGNAGEQRGATRAPVAPPKPPVQSRVTRERGDEPAPARHRAPRAAGAGKERTRVVAPRSGSRGGKAGKGYESKWDKYVADFIKRYQLNNEQQQKAHSVLADCKKQAARYLKSKQSVLERIDKQLASLRGSKSKDKSKQQKALTDKRAKLMAPIDRIFENQLKPRLERIPTRAQRKAAESRQQRSQKRKGQTGGTKDKGKSKPKKP